MLLTNCQPSCNGWSAGKFLPPGTCFCIILLFIFPKAGLCQGQFKMVVFTLEYFRYNQNCVCEMHSSKKKTRIETLGGKKRTMALSNKILALKSLHCCHWRRVHRELKQILLQSCSGCQSVSFRLFAGMIQFNRGKLSTSRDQESAGVSMEIQKQFVLIWQKEEGTELCERFCTLS